MLIVDVSHEPWVDEIILQFVEADLARKRNLFEDEALAMAERLEKIRTLLIERTDA